MKPLWSQFKRGPIWQPGRWSRYFSPSRLISPEEVDLAREKGVYLELSTRKGHSLTNGHVLKLALARGAKVVINNDAHSPSDLVSKELRTRIALGAGLTLEEVNLLENNSLELVEKIRSRSHGRKV